MYTVIRLVVGVAFVAAMAQGGGLVAGLLAAIVIVIAVALDSTRL